MIIMIKIIVDLCYVNRVGGSQPFYRIYLKLVNVLGVKKKFVLIE